MKILHVAESAQGGVGTYLAEVLPHQVERLGVNNIRALIPDRHAGHVSGVDRRVLQTWRRGNRRSVTSLARLAHAIRSEVRRFAPTVIHAHSSFAGAVVRAMYGVKRPAGLEAIIYCPHGWGFDRQEGSNGNGVFARVARALAHRCDAIVVISEHERQQALAAGLPTEQLHLVLNGIADVPPVHPSRWEDERLKILFVGRLDEQKGIDTLLDAVEPFGDKLCVRIVGKAVVGGAQGQRNVFQVEWLGWRSLAEVATEIAAADVVVVPSRWEGFGLVALEAMRGGCAVVASRVGGLAEIVVDGVTGRLVDPDSPEQLSRALISGSRDAWHAMGHAGRARFLSHFTADRLNDELIALYQQVIARRTGVAAMPLVAHA